ncbi:response regulator transcription factor [Mucilaginibacter ginkgonis]|uniref:Two-component system response regulator n=1 Tax=Mucilaginibacter ginkgonis TaxID=2682091 RepID=A0A6I4HY69_9SPHI|nr:response regulator [Mucilaginibacter ginkgonis]QQL51242.1 two-component system response regulator [Mucilaginibacter ginkgonis]
MKLQHLSNKPRLQKRQILIVDSEWNILKLLYAFLSREFTVVAKNNAVDAFHWLLSNNQPAIIIAELKSTGFDDLSFLKHLKYSGLYKDIPVILLTEYRGEEQKNADPFDIADVVLMKPFNPSYLIYKINHLINAKSIVA